MTALLFPSSDHKVARKLTWMFSLPNSIGCFSVFAPFSSLSVSLSASFILFIAFPPSFLSFLLEQHICVFVHFFICVSLSSLRFFLSVRFLSFNSLTWSQNHFCKVSSHLGIDHICSWSRLRERELWNLFKDRNSRDMY